MTKEKLLAIANNELDKGGEVIGNYKTTTYIDDKGLFNIAVREEPRFVLEESVVCTFKIEKPEI
jgi:hypothetical protein